MLKRFISRSTAVLGLSLGLGLTSGGVFAAACQTPASGGDPLFAGSPGGVTTAGMTFRGNEADDCAALYDGNDSLSEITAIATALSWGGPFVGGGSPDELKSDGGGADTATLLGIDWTLSYTDTGGWTLSYDADPDVTKTLDVVAVLKQSQGWAAFLFEDEVFATDGSDPGTFTAQWCPGQNPFESCTVDPFDLSHLQIFLAESDQQVPEPATIGLLGLGLALLAVANRRRRVALQ